MTKKKTLDGMKTFTVLLSSPRPLPTTNPYNIMLIDELEQLEGLTTKLFTWRGALLGNYDVFHVHWPEILVTGRTSLRKVARQLCTVLLLIKMTVLRTGLVRTVHNLELPSGISRRERFLLSWLDRRTDVRIVLNTHTPVPLSAPCILIPHGHYVDWFSRFARSEPIPGRITYFGSIRRYKSIDQLLNAFSNTSSTSPEITLTISGRTSSDELTQLVEGAMLADSRISAHLGFVDDAALTQQVSAAQLVVLPYREMHNSGAVLAALSIGRPVLLPRNEVNQELAEEVGQVWVQMYDGELGGEDIQKALAVTADIGVDARPDLSARRWDTGAQEHARAYRLAAGTRSRPRRQT